MKSEKEILRRLHDHEKRLSSLESGTKKPKSQTRIKSTKSLSDYLLDLRDSGFFNQPKTVEEAHSKLSVKYHCELNRVAVALKRLSDRRKLRKASKKISAKQYKAYVW